MTRCGWWRLVWGVLCRRSAGNWPVTVAGSGIGLIVPIWQLSGGPVALNRPNWLNIRSYVEFSERFRPFVLLAGLLVVAEWLFRVRRYPLYA